MNSGLISTRLNQIIANGSPEDFADYFQLDKSFLNYTEEELNFIFPEPEDKSFDDSFTAIFFNLLIFHNFHYSHSVSTFEDYVDRYQDQVSPLLKVIISGMILSNLNSLKHSFQHEIYFTFVSNYVTCLTFNYFSQSAMNRNLRSDSNYRLKDFKFVLDFITEEISRKTVKFAEETRYLEATINPSQIFRISSMLEGLFPNFKEDFQKIRNDLWGDPIDTICFIEAKRNGLDHMSKESIRSIFGAGL